MLDLCVVLERGQYQFNAQQIKTWIRPFNGVATKYLGHYMYWFNWCEKTVGLTVPKRAED